MPPVCVSLGCSPVEFARLFWRNEYLLPALLQGLCGLADTLEYLSCLLLTHLIRLRRCLPLLLLSCVTLLLVLRLFPRFLFFLLIILRLVPAAVPVAGRARSERQEESGSARVRDCALRQDLRGSLRSTSLYASIACVVLFHLKCSIPPVEKRVQPQVTCRNPDGIVVIVQRLLVLSKSIPGGSPRYSEAHQYVERVHRPLRSCQGQQHNHRCGRSS